ncbi:type IV pilus assembly protein PilM [Candidatus Parcubacteria bacterium]|nr:type IV pilus assembly protein PilM [Patescibacteria group bacterium]MCG2688299.1 type IV pilus assembly protein PilM [Candidatus Parcubacteria bacterium]
MKDFLTLKPVAFGLDISDSSIKIAKLKQRGKDFDLACFGEQSLPEGVIVGGEIRDEKVLADFIKRAIASTRGEKLKTKEVVVSLPDEKTFLRVIQLPKMTSEELAKAVLFEAENHIPIPLKDSYFDFKAVDPIVDHLDHSDVLVVATPKDVVDSYSRVVKLAGLDPRVFEVESLAISRALIKNMITINPVLLIDFGETRTVLVVFAGRSIRFTSLLSFSSKQLTEDLAAGLKVSSDQARKIKMDHGLESKIKVQLQEKTGDFKLEKEIMETEKILEILDSSLSHLILEIKEFLNFYYSHRSHEHLPPTRTEIKKILISGGGANLKGFDDYLTKKLGISTRIANPWTNILPEPETRIPEEYLRRSLAYSETLGLALRGIMAE